MPWQALCHSTIPIGGCSSLESIHVVPDVLATCSSPQDIQRRMILVPQICDWDDMSVAEPDALGREVPAPGLVNNVFDGRERQVEDGEGERTGMLKGRTNYFVGE